MISRRLMLRSIRRLYEWVKNDPVDEELRGWSWDKPPLKPRAYLGLTISEIASKYCQTRRNIWLLRKMNVKPEATEPLQKGKLIHESISLAISGASRLLTNGYKPWEAYEALKNHWRKIAQLSECNTPRTIEAIYKYTLMIVLGEASYEALVHGQSSPQVIISEYRVDGSSLGLSSSLSIDVLTDNVIIDFKYGAPREFHKLSLTGHALALESELEIPFNYGLLIYYSDGGRSIKASYRPIYISNNLRRWFIEERDSIIDMLLDEQEPPRDSDCPLECPFYKVCNQ
ncbi:MAG: type I-A CRISPR-associated protein Cas4/Csa1 [Sulfolobales archaeon]|nr:type I-A CRISPR-associated protein Cas4/Csa1 [Sulfolobales archaeon]